MTPIRLLLADDHQLLRAGLKNLLGSLGAEVIGEAADGVAACELAAALSPDVVLMDIGMPGMNGLEAAAAIRRAQPQVRVVMLSMHAGEDYVTRSLRAGATGYMLKDSAPEELEFALDAVMRGNLYLCPGVARGVLDPLLAQEARPQAGAVDRLTVRQRQILQLIAEGHSTKEMARRLGLSVKTVEAHRSQLMKRVGIHDIPGLVRLAMRSGLVAAEQ